MTAIWNKDLPSPSRQVFRLFCLVSGCLFHSKPKTSEMSASWNVTCGNGNWMQDYINVLHINGVHGPVSTATLFPAIRLSLLENLNSMLPNAWGMFYDVYWCLLMTRELARNSYHSSDHHCSDKQRFFPFGALPANHDPSLSSQAPDPPQAPWHPSPKQNWEQHAQQNWELKNTSRRPGRPSLLLLCGACLQMSIGGEWLKAESKPSRCGSKMEEQERY